jgi:hypothetical protein
MKSVLALTAFLWFAYNAATFGDGGVSDPQHQQSAGDQGVMAAHAAAQILFVGLALVSLALVNWGPLNKRISEIHFFD